MIERLESERNVFVSGHRGYKSAYPENTLLAFAKALELGVPMLEFDLRSSRDGEIVVIHDETVDRTTDGSGRVSDLPLAELKKLDAGGWFGPAFAGLRIPTLTELCELLRPYPELLLNVEIKPAPDGREVADAAVALLESYGYLERCVFTSFDADVLAHIHDRYGRKTQGFPGEVMRNFVDGPEGTYAKMWAIALNMKQLTPDAADACRERGHLVWCYCPDDEAQVRYALACGVTTMTCNDPVPALAIARHPA
ncbi:glycerophosphodiester phosphodiesterase family protein [Cohnella nanjingensis]|uniref:Glycerophosphodiester phosphodiesterase n=1 Tax=Cohnella nanjingensis TaxID=1387779 RepID=A0A7X0RSV4_9BACL|nr:glycerophosphodiester phosphodiesterase family protein [Cohnella nanjingensis]MBB6671584.1 glycerophosphodiester phosphodiesterase [Cohnella nanjingensis]